MPPSPGHFCASSVTAAPWGQKKQERAMSQSQRVTGPEADIAGIMFRLATATTKSKTRSRRPSTRSRPGFFLPVGMGLATVVLPFYFATQLTEVFGGASPVFFVPGTLWRTWGTRPRVKIWLDSCGSGCSGEGSWGGAGPAFEGSREHCRLCVAYRVSYGGDCG